MPSIKPPKKTATPTKTETGERTVVHPKIRTEICQGKQVLTVLKMKQLMGWTEDPLVAKEAGLDVEEPLLYVRRDGAEAPVWCVHNNHNRPFSESWARRIGHDILHRHWADSRNGPGRTLNGETVIVGRYGTILSAQHRLLGAILAEEDRLLDPESYEQWWKEPISIETIIVYGVDESIETVRTLDNTKPRTFGDVLFADGTFGKVSVQRQKTLSRMTDYSIRFLWNRLGIPIKATHSEVTDWLQRHPRLKEAVRAVEEANMLVQGQGQVARYLAPGYASALFYLMAASGTDEDLYYGKPPRERSERDVDFSLWETATRFWTAVADTAPELKGLRVALAAMADDKGIDRGTLAEKCCVFLKAWNFYASGEDVTEKRVRPRYDTHQDSGRLILNDHVVVGGIDRSITEQERDTTPSEEEREETARAIREERAAKGSRNGATKKRQSRVQDEEE